MAEKIYINGIGLVHPSGNMSALLAAYSGNSIDADSASVPSLAELLPGVSMRRVPKAARMGLQASLLAVRNAGLAAPFADEMAPKVGVFTGAGHGAVENGFGFMDSIIDFGPKLASPTAFSHSVNNVFTGMTSLYLNAQGPGYTATQFDLSFSGILMAAGGSLLLGACDYALLGVVEETNDFLKLVYELDWFIAEESGQERGQLEKPLSECAVSFLLSRNNTGLGIELSLPVWNEADALALAGDMVFSSGISKVRHSSLSACVTDCHALYGATPMAHALDVALAASALASGVPPAPAWYAGGSAPSAFSRILCEIYDAHARAYSAVSLSC